MDNDTLAKIIFLTVGGVPAVSMLAWGISEIVSNNSKKNQTRRHATNLAELGCPLSIAPRVAEQIMNDRYDIAKFTLHSYGLSEGEAYGYVQLLEQESLVKKVMGR